MSSNPFNADPSRLGTIENIDGSAVSVKLSDDTPSGLVFVKGEGYRVGQVGGFVRIPAGYVDLFGIISQVGAGAAPGPPESAPLLGNRWLRVELVGEGRRGGKFERGISQYPSIGDPVHLATESDLRSVYAAGDEEGYVDIGRVASAESIRAFINLNRLINRHSAVVGSTGAGKSTVVATILNAVSSEDQFKSARVVLLDLHGEYTRAFGDRARVFRIGADPEASEQELFIPFWALTFDEFKSIAMGNVIGTPLVLLQECLLGQRRSSKPCGRDHGVATDKVTVDTPLPFSVYKLWHDLYSEQCATHDKSGNQNQSKSSRAYTQIGDPPANAVGDADKLIRPSFLSVEQGSGATKIYKGQHLDLPRAHLETLENNLKDPRLQFLFKPGDWSVSQDGTTISDIDVLLQNWVGGDKPISVFDLSGIPPTVSDLLVGALLRILFDALFWGRLKAEGGKQRPLLLVLEEAHKYLSAGLTGHAARAVGRIAKEGRKYGVGLMLVSQRPSEIDHTVLSQCGTITALRLTNDTDRNQVSAAASDNLKGLFLMLPILRTGEALIVGEAVNMPVRAVIDQPPEGRRPASDDPMAVVPKGKDGKRIRPGGWTEAVEGEDYAGLVQAWRTQDARAKAPVKVLSETTLLPRKEV